MPIPAIGALAARALPAAGQLLSKAPGLSQLSGLLGGGGGGDQAQAAPQGAPGAAANILQSLKSKIPGLGGE